MPKEFKSKSRGEESAFSRINNEIAVDIVKVLNTRHNIELPERRQFERCLCGDPLQTEEEKKRDMCNACQILEF